MASVTLSPLFNGWQGLGSSLVLLNGGLLNSYLAGSTTPSATYTTSAGNVQNANPIVLNSDGRPPQEIWLVQGTAYKFILTDALGNVLGTYDNIIGVNDFSTLSASGGSALIGFIQTGSGAVATTLQANDRLSFNIQQFGGAGDGVTNNTTAFNNAITALNALGGGDLFVPAASGKYFVSTTVTLKPNIRIVLQGCTIHFTGGATSCFQFVGASEAASLNGSILGVGTIESSTTTTGYGVRLRNFSNFIISNGVVITNFSRAVKTDWGIGLYVLEGCTLVTNTRGLETGGNDNLPVGISAGIRGSPGTAYMDTIVVRGVGFSTNVYDINDMGSTQSLGCISVTNSTFYESSTPVAGKAEFVRIANRKGIVFQNNWVESPNATRVGLNLQNTTADAASVNPCNGAIISGNDFLMNAATSNGVLVTRALGVKIEGNNFEGPVGEVAINLVDAVAPAEVGINNYMTYPDSTAMTAPISIANPVAGHRTPGGAKQLTDAATVTSDAASGDYFLLTATTSRTIGAPANPSDGKQITFDIYNGSGGAMTTTWNAIFAKSWTDPANTKRKTIVFRYTAASTLWVQVGTVSADL